MGTDQIEAETSFTSGLDSSTQSLKAVLIDCGTLTFWPKRSVVFDRDLPEFKTDAAAFTVMKTGVTVTSPPVCGLRRWTGCWSE